MDDYLYYSALFDIYEHLFTPRQQSVFKNYFFENLTLDEIASLTSVSKSAVAKMIKQMKSRLDELESDLHFYEYMNKIKKEFANEKETLNRILKYDNIIL